MELQAALPSGKQNVRIFLVEDSALIRERLERMLSGIAGARIVGSAAGAQDAIRSILAARPDVVLLDYQLAQGNGFDVLRALHERAPEIDVYMLSSFPSEPYRIVAERLGARRFFDKSTEFERVRDALAARVPASH
jgi:DNA-binding NarL/FixJ family response regulator